MCPWPLPANGRFGDAICAARTSEPWSSIHARTLDHRPLS
jgi:hypothetical protein